MKKACITAALAAQLFVVLLFVIGTSSGSLIDEFADPCGPNMELHACNGCEKTCANRFSGLICAAVCSFAGCQCKNGYIRESTNGPCILESKCPPLSAPTGSN